MKYFKILTTHPDGSFIKQKTKCVYASSIYSFKNFNFSTLGIDIISISIQEEILPKEFYDIKYEYLLLARSVIGYCFEENLKNLMISFDDEMIKKYNLSFFERQEFCSELGIKYIY